MLSPCYLPQKSEVGEIQNYIKRMDLSQNEAVGKDTSPGR